MACSAACGWSASTTRSGCAPRATGFSPPRTPRSRWPRPGLVQGAVEGSNVSPVLEMTRMTDELREFQFAARIRRTRGRAAADRRRPHPAPRSCGSADEGIPDHALPAHRRHRHAGAADQCRGHLQQHRQYEHHRLQAAAGRIPGPALREHAPGRLAELGERQHAALRRADRARRQTAAIYRIGEQGNLSADREPLRPGGARQWLLPGAAALGRDRLYPRRHLRPLGRRARSSPRRASRCCRHHHPRLGARRHHQRCRRGAGQDRRPGGTAECRPDPDRDLRQ